jgi:DNA-directed RNA polymerase subunit beta
LYLTAEKEDGMVIAPSNTPIDSHNRFVTSHVRARKSGDYVVVTPEEVELIDVAPNQIVSAAAALIPFLEHDDANRALMGSNMQRQAVPLLRPESPYVGTGLESKIARDSRSLIVAEGDGVVEYVDSMRIIVRYDDNLSPTEKLISFEDTTTTEYKLIKFFRTNQDTCINQRPVVKEGQRVKAGDVLADGVSSQNGELALGRNLLVAFMPWRGYNFEDAIIISERLVAEDVYTSIHIEEFTSQVRDTKRGEEEFTREIPNVSEEATKDLDENGVVRVGAEIKENDILIGKITPKGETDPTPEEKLLRAIFGDKAGDVKDASLKATPGLKGVVIETKLFSRKGLKKDSMNVRREDRKVAENLDRQFKRDLKDLNDKLCAKLGKLLDGEVSTGIRDVEGKIFIRSGATLKENTFFDKMKDDPELNFALLDSTDEWVEDKRKANIVRRMFGNYKQKFYQLEAELRHEKSKLAMGDELQPGIMQMAKVYVAKKRKLSVGDKMSGRHGNKGVVAKIVPVEDMPFLPDGTPVDIILNPLGVPSRMNLGQLYETALGWAAEKLGVKFATPIFDGASWGDVQKKLTEANLPSNSCTKLFDGRTGNMFDQEIMVGRIYMMKLAHLVDDKIHARSVGPYSLITQQPLGGKAQFGGQRFGEMEVWALEAYGASNTLQEMLTVKSDDVQGRSKAYEAIVKGENLPIPNIPESFNVLIRELQGIALELKLE